MLHEGHAASFAAYSEAETGTLSGNAGETSDGTASGSSAVTFGTASTGPQPNPVGQPAGKWTLNFDDEFDGPLTTVDSTNGLVKIGNGPTWKAWYPNDAVGDGNQHSNNPGTELEYFGIPGLSAANGILTLTATHDKAHSNVGLPYTSGMIQSNPSFNTKYGYAEVRLKSPGVSGSWPAFWIISSTYEWPPEVDIYENFGDPTFYKASNFGGGATVFGDPISTDVTAWHTYGLQWEPGVLVWYLDGTAVATERTASSVPGVNMYIVLDLAVRNTDTQTFSAQADYVRYWK